MNKQSMVNAVAPVFFLIMLLASGIYIVPYLNIPAVPYIGTAGLAFGKQVLFVCLMLMLGSTLRWREAMATKFTLLCCIWVLVHMVHWLLRLEYGEIYFHRMVQIVFIWVFVNYILQLREGDGKPYLGLQVWFYPPFFGMSCILVVIFSFDVEIASLIQLGFGGNSFGFSIWLSQFVFLTLFFYLNFNSKSQSIHKAIVWATSILILQVFTGGRAGLMASFAIFIYFSYQHGGFRWVLLCVPYLLAVTAFAHEISVFISTQASVGVGPGGGIGLHVLRIVPAIGIEPNLFNELNVKGSDQLHLIAVKGNDLLQWLDRLLSFRLTIMIDAFSRKGILPLFFGSGVGNFQGNLPSGIMNHVHNIYLRALGELGVVGFATLIALTALPFRKQSRPFFKQLANLDKSKSVVQKNTTAMLVYIGVVILLGMLHSEYITTALSTCLIFWLCYAEILRGQAATNLGGS
jgi:hypothetical protein